MKSKPLQKIIQHEAYRIVGLQLSGVIAIALCTWLMAGNTAGFSALMGGLAYGIPNLIFVWRVFRYTGAQQMQKFLTAFFIGETIKLTLAAILFLLIVKYLPVSLLSVLVGFVAAIMSFWFACMWHFSRQNTSRQQGAAG